MRKQDNRLHVLLHHNWPVWLAVLVVLGLLTMGSSSSDDEPDPPNKHREHGIESEQEPPPKTPKDTIFGDANLASDDSEGWSQVGGKRVKIDDEFDHNGRVFQDSSKRTLLLVPSQGEWVFLLDLISRQVSALDRNILLWDKLDRPIPDSSTLLFIGPLVDYEGYIRFDYGDRTYVIQPIPPVVGEQSIDTIYELLPEYDHIASKYHPNAEIIKTLQNLTQDSRLLVFFATWSPLSKHWIPRLMKTLELAKNRHLLVTYYGVNQDLDQPQFEIESHRVTAVPTVIIVRRNRELGRIETLPKQSIEEDLARILGALPELSD